MHKILGVSAFAAVAFISTIAGAVTLQNNDRNAIVVGVTIGGKPQTLTLPSGHSFDSKGKDATFKIGNNKPVAAQGNDKIFFKNGKIDLQKADQPPVAAPPVAPKAQ